MITISIEKTQDALRLEKKLGINFDLTQKHAWDAGYDIRACIPSAWTIFARGGRVIVPTGLKIQLHSQDYEIQCRPRSGLSAKNGISVGNSPGTIDAGYRDEIKVILINTDPISDFTIEPGMRIAQLAFRAIPQVKINYVDKISYIEDRGGGFGSSGLL